MEEITKLKTFLDDQLDTHPQLLIFLRGDSNVNNNNKDRVKIVGNFLRSLKLVSIPISHKTYHHFLGGGLFDSNIDIIAQTKHEEINEEISNIRCSSYCYIFDRPRVCDKN